jgi:cellulose synthase/poly-beta-1,6-N-acetylglucosamine synthase-like glycosyltransferase
MIVLQILSIILLTYFGFNVCYMLVYALAGLFYRQPKFPEREPKVSFCVMVPAYKGDDVIINTVTENLKQTYPKSLYDIYVIADSFKPETIETLKNYDVQVIEVQFENSTKSKAINKAFEVIEEKYDYVVLLDVDNIMEPALLQKLNNRLVNNVQILQAHRTALNTNTSYALLDAISEEISNHIFRKGHAALGFSSALIGSGKAAGFRFFKDIMSSIDAVGGFDKELELKILKQRIKMYYLEDGYVYDEKVEKADVFQNQRRRWLSAQIYYLRKNFFSGIVQLFYGNFDYADKIMQYMLFPKLLLIGTLFIITPIVYFSGQPLYGNTWLLFLVLNIIALAISIPPKYLTAQTAKAVLTLPKAFLLFFSNLFKLKGANKKFIHTPHGQKAEK